MSALLSTAGRLHDLRAVLEIDSDTLLTLMRVYVRKMLALSDDELERGEHKLVEPVFMFFQQWVKAKDGKPGCAAAMRPGCWLCAPASFLLAAPALLLQPLRLHWATRNTAPLTCPLCLPPSLPVDPAAATSSCTGWTSRTTCGGWMWCPAASRCRCARTCG